MSTNTQQYHNPENVPADKVPKGWRFLTVEEQRQRANPRYTGPAGCRYWITSCESFSGDEYSTGYRPDWTYIIRDTQPEPSPSPWIAFSERKPTDADGRYIFVCDPMSGPPMAYRGPFTAAMWDSAPFQYTHWMRIPPLPVERKPTQEEKDVEAAQAWWKDSQSPLKNQLAYAHQLEHGWLEKQAFLAGLRHARAQGKEGV